MYVGSAIRADIRVSIQDRSAPDRVSGHVATGILVDGDTVLVPNSAFDDRLDLEILIFPIDVDEHSAVDVARPWRWSRFTVRGKTVALTAKLMQHSTYAGQVGELGEAAFASALEDLGGDVWAALARLDAIAPDVHAIDPTWLATITEVERLQAQPTWVSHELESYAQLPPIWRVFFGFGHPNGHK